MWLLGQGGGGGFNWGSLIQLALVVLIFGGGAISAGIKKAAERRAQKQVERERQRQREEMLRTGRMEGPNSAVPPLATSSQFPTETSTPTSREQVLAEAQQRLRELAQRRKQEMSQKGKGGSARTVPPTTNRGGTQPVPMQPMPTRPVPTQAEARSTQSRDQRTVIIEKAGGIDPRVAEAQRQQAMARKQAEARKRAAKDAQRQLQQEEAERRELAAEKAARARRQQQEAAKERAEKAADIASGAVAAPSSTTEGRGAEVLARVQRIASQGTTPGQAADWRKAIILAEVLNKPMSMR